MSPITHLVGSWLVAVATTSNPRDRKLVTLAGVLPDVDGLGAVADVLGSWCSGKECTYAYYQQYHHVLLHGWQNQCIFLALFATSIWVAVKRGCSFVEIISDRSDAVVVQVLRKWWALLVTACRR